MNPVSRRVFVSASTAALAAPAIGPRAAVAAFEPEDSLPPSFPAQDPEVASSVVGKSHFDYDTVRTMVTARPELAKATWDWGFGDWETALGAASHMGRRDIAELLLAHGARPDLFTFAMLGHVDVVRAACEASPGIQGALGPHGITLLQHARAGRDAAVRVVEYLEELGGADVGQPSLPLTEEDARIYLGDYQPERGAGEVFRIGWHERRALPTFACDDGPFRVMFRIGDHAFAPGGAPSVRIEFDVRGGEVRGLAVRDGSLHVAARRSAS